MAERLAPPQGLKLDLETVFQSPEFLLHRISTKANALKFLRMSPQSYRDSRFLDDQALRADASDYWFPIDEALSYLEANSSSVRPILYIFHTAFCSSTLLCRCFEATERCFVLKEPVVYYHLSLARRAVGPDEPERFAELKGLIRLTHALMGRTYSE